MGGGCRKRQRFCFSLMAGGEFLFSPHKGPKIKDDRMEEDVCWRWTVAEGIPDADKEECAQVTSTPGCGQVGSEAGPVDRDEGGLGE